MKTVCVCCLRVFQSNSIGMKGVFKKQSIAAGVCPECEVTYGEDVKKKEREWRNFVPVE